MSVNSLRYHYPALEEHISLPNDPGGSRGDNLPDTPRERGHGSGYEAGRVAGGIVYDSGLMDFVTWLR